MKDNSTVGGRRQQLRFYNNSVAVGHNPLASLNQGAVVPRSQVLYETIEGETVPYTIINNVHNPADLTPSYIARTEGRFYAADGGSWVRCKRPPKHTLAVGGSSGRGLTEQQQANARKQAAFLVLQQAPDKVEKAKKRLEAWQSRLDDAKTLKQASYALKGCERALNHLQAMERNLELYESAVIELDNSTDKELLRRHEKGRSLRGRVSDFSHASRWRMIQRIGKLRTDQIPLFVTMTYPGEFDLDPREWKRDLDTFFKRLRRRFPQASAVWKLEPQQRGAPHYHLFIWGVHEILLREWIAQAWYEVVNSGDHWHYLKGTRVEAVRSWAGVRSYAAKYMGKEQKRQEGWDFPGRWWGVFNAAKLPHAVIREFILPRSESILTIRTMRNYAKIGKRKRKRRGKAGNDFPSLTIICNDASFWLKHVTTNYRCYEVPTVGKKRG